MTSLITQSATNKSGSSVDLVESLSLIAPAWILPGDMITSGG